MIKAIPDAVKPFVDYTNGTDIHPTDLENILPEDPHGWEYCNFRLEYPIGNPSYPNTSRPLFPIEEDKEEMSAAVKLLVGIALVIVAEFFHGVQFVYEAKYLTKYNLPPGHPLLWRWSTQKYRRYVGRTSPDLCRGQRRLDYLLDPWKYVLHCRLQLCRNHGDEGADSYHSCGT